MSVEFLKKSEDECLTDLEIRSLITNLSQSQADLFKLSQIAKKHIWGCQMEADDLLQDAITSVLSGDRKFPRNVNPIAFFAQTMKSIAFNERRKTFDTITTIDNELDNDPVNNIAANNIDLEIEVSASQEIKRIYDLFENDDDVATFLIEKDEGKSPDEICKSLGWNRTKYDSVQKRLRRSLNKHFPNGRET